MTTPKLIISIIMICFAITAHAAKLCLGTPIVPVSSISVACNSYSIAVNATTTCTATVNPNNATDKGVSWLSNSQGILTVIGSGTDNATGTIIGVSVGSTTVRATSTAYTDISGTGNSITITAGFSSSPDFCYRAISSSTALSINSIFSSICSPLSVTSRFPYNFCDTKIFDMNAQTWEATFCPLAAYVSIYGNSRCSTRNDPGHGWGNGCYRSVSTVPPNDAGENCWCQLCTDSTRTNCGAWMFSEESWSCGSSCANICAYYTLNSGDSLRSRAGRIAMCAAPN